jgi:hypothetical protein
MTVHCDKCGLPLGFRENKRGKREPCNPDGTDHWDTCRETRLKHVKEGKHYRHTENDGTYREGYSNDGVSMDIGRGGVTIVGKLYRPVPDDGTPPWE